MQNPTLGRTEEQAALGRPETAAYTMRLPAL